MSPILRLATVALPLIFVAACSTTGASVTTDYYAVSGATSGQLDKALRRNGPMNGHALAMAAIRFVPVSVLQEQSAKGCRFRTASFKVEAAITLPKWKNRNESKDAELRRAWDNLARYAKIHEETHVKIAKLYADRLGREVKALAPQANCEALDKMAAKVVKQVSREHNKAQLLFDEIEQKRLAALAG